MKEISERISILKLEISEGIIMTIIQVYAPIAVTDQRETHRFYDLLEKAVQEEIKIITL